MPNHYKKYLQLLPKRRIDMNKGDCGRVFIIAGSVGMTGAACLCTKAALRSGSGLVTLGTPECVQPIAASVLLEAMTLPLPCNDGKLSKASVPAICDKVYTCDVCAIGPGLGNTNDIREIISSILKQKTHCVIDADGLNSIADCTELLNTKTCSVVITPHPGEMSRLTGLSIEEINADRTGVALTYAKEWDCVVLLKGFDTVIASPDGEFCINKTGNCGMASGGMGDVLTGIIASFIGQGCTLYDAACLGAYIHGLAADIAALEVGEFGLIASDVVKKIPNAIIRLSGK